MDKKAGVSEEKIDYLREMMNIAAGNAATALSQLLQHEVDVKLPNVFILPISKVSSIFQDPLMPVLCVKTEMVGDVTGTMFFVVPDEQKKNLLKLLKKSMPDALRKRLPVDSTAIEEIANIVAGVFLAAIHDFSKLNIYHTVPVLAIDMIQSLLDESLESLSNKAKEIFIIENEFIVKEGNVRTVLFVIPMVESIEALFGSMETVRKEYGIE